MQTVKGKPNLASALVKMTAAGRAMANICFNLSRRGSLPAREREIMEACQKDWDSAIYEFRQVERRAKGLLRNALKGKEVRG